MEKAPAPPLDQALAAIIDLLIALIADLAAEHPLLAPGLRASIRQLEKLSRSLQAMVAEWQATRHQPRLHARRRPKTPHTRTAPGIRQNRPHQTSARPARKPLRAAYPRAPPA